MVWWTSGHQRIGPERVRLQDHQLWPSIADVQVGSLVTNDIERQESEGIEHVNRLSQSGLDDRQEGFDMLSNQRLRVEKVGLREGMAQKSSSLAVRLLVPQAENPQRFHRHGFVRWGLDEVCLGTVEFLDDLLVREGDFVGTDANSVSILAVQLVKCAHSTAC